MIPIIFKRSLASLADFIIILMPYLIICFLLLSEPVLISLPDPSLTFIDQNEDKLRFFTSILIFLTAVLYFGLFESSGSQATPGKKIFKLYVSDSNNQRVSYAKAFFRYFLFALPGFITSLIKLIDSDSSAHLSTIIWIFSIFWCLPIFTPERKTLYDLLSSTKVSAKPDSSEQLKQELEEQGKLLNELKERLNTQSH